jgi:hypothetical protein
MNFKNRLENLERSLVADPSEGDRAEAERRLGRGEKLRPIDIAAIKALGIICVELTGGQGGSIAHADKAGCVVIRELSHDDMRL